MKILYVEDNLTNVSLVKRIARKHEVISYVDGEEALRNFDKDNPDLVLMDVQLAGKMTGLDVVKKLREDGHTLPIIAVTAYAMIGDKERCLEAGCSDYIAKPLPIPKLIEIITQFEAVLLGRDQPEPHPVTVLKETQAPLAEEPPRRSMNTTEMMPVIEAETEPKNPQTQENNTPTAATTSEK